MRFTQKTASYKFSDEGDFSGQTITQVSNGLRSGSIAVNSVPVEVIYRNGMALIVNTRSSLSLMRANIPPSQWRVIDVSNNPIAVGKINQRLNSPSNGLGDNGSSVIRITGSGIPRSSNVD